MSRLSTLNGVVGQGQLRRIAVEGAMNFILLYLYLEIRIVAISTDSLYRVWGINVSAALGLTAKTPDVYFLLCPNEISFPQSSSPV